MQILPPGASTRAHSVTAAPGSRIWWSAAAITRGGGTGAPVGRVAAVVAGEPSVYVLFAWRLRISFHPWNTAGGVTMSKPKPIAPGRGQESVWDYPRPPRIEDTSARIEVLFSGALVADTRRAKRVLETSHPPVYYIPAEDIRMELLRAQDAGRRTHCEWKGRARYFDIVVGDRVAETAAWSYPHPTEHFAPIADYLAFYAGRVDQCRVDGERVKPQAGEFYGGWITDAIVGPFKGVPGSWGW
jgi:uncharacterized protein (DUF427 family)